MTPRTETTWHPSVVLWLAALLTCAGLSAQKLVSTIVRPLDSATNLAQVGGSAVALGQTTMSASVPVVIASNQGAVSVSAVNPNLEQAQASSTSGQVGPLMQAAATTAAATCTTGRTCPLSMNTNSGLRVDPSGVTSPVSLASLPALAAGTNIAGGFYLYDYGGTNEAGVNSAHQQYVDIEGQKTTFVAGITALGVSNTATDVFCVGVASGSKTFHLTQVKISGTATANSTITPQIVIRSTLDSGGTTSSPTVYKMNTTSGTASTAAALAYTANPSALGTAASVIDEQVGTLTTATSATVAITPIIFYFGDNNEAQGIFSGSTYEACVYLGGAAPSGASLSIMMRWTEE